MLFRKSTVIAYNYKRVTLDYSVSDPLHFNAVPDPLIRFRDNGSWSGSISGSGSDSGSDLKSSKFQSFSSHFFSVKGIKLIMMFFFCNFELIILNKISDFFFKKWFSYNFGWIVCEFITIYFLQPGSRSTFPEVDPVPDPAKWYGSNRIRIRNTVRN